MSELRDESITLRQSVAIQIVVWIVAAVLTYGAVNARVAVLETRQLDLDRRLQRIETKLDTVVDAVLGYVRK
jgi:hypothetical protein